MYMRYLLVFPDALLHESIWLDDVYGIRDYSLGEAVQTTIIEPGAITEGATPDVAAQIKKVQASASINWRR